MSKLTNLVGQTFARLTVTSFEGRIKGINYWNCICTCGRTRKVREWNLRTGNSKTCGICIMHERSRDLIHSKEYRAYNSIKTRCLNKNADCWKDYGGRGIKMCDRWQKSYDNFLEDMGIAPSPSHSVDRINNDGNYEPDNCRWATKKEQGNNRRNSLRVEYKGQIKTLGEWCLELNVNMMTVYSRIHSRRYSVEEAFELPKFPYFVRVKKDGKILRHLSSKDPVRNKEHHTK